MLRGQCLVIKFLTKDTIKTLKNSKYNTLRSALLSLKSTLKACGVGGALD